MKLTTFIHLFLIFTHTALSQVVQLEGVYATSTEIPLEQNSVVNLFDDDPFTNWKTIKGAGPNEGIMLYFTKPTYISKVEVNKISGADLGELSYYEVYGDGQSFWSGRKIEKELSSLYIKIAGSKDSERVESKYEDKDYYRTIFNSGLSIGIAELVIYGESKTEPLTVKPPKFVKGTIQASSSLKPDLAYGPGNLMDSRKDFGWAEGTQGNGIDQQLTFTTEEEVTISSIKIWNGYQRSPSHFSGNSRLKSFQFGTGEGSPGLYFIEDDKTPQMVKLDQPITGKKFVLTVKDAFSGAKYQDLVISELKFFDGDKPIIIQTSSEEKRIRSIKSLTNPLLDYFVDRNMNVTLRSSKEENKDGEYYSEYYGKTTNLILRSNNTFVMYEREILSVEEYREEDNYENFGDDITEIIADGNWELKEEGDGFLKVRIFGKIFSPTTSAELYQGDVTSANVRIFQDNLTLTRDKITGERFINDIILKEN